MVHEWVDTRIGDTSWVQTIADKVAAAGTTVKLSATDPKRDRWNLAVIELVK